MSPARTALATAALALTFAVPSAAQTPVDPEPLVTKSLFFECQGAQPATKVQNSLLVPDVSWSETKPAASYTSGAGCGFADTSLSGTTPDNALYDAVFGGSFDERVKTANIELHDLAGPVLNNLSASSTFVVRLLIDGAEVTPVAGVQVEAGRTPSPSGASSSVRFSLNFKKELPKLEGRQFRIGIKNFFADSAAAWVYGAAEIPAGIEFNPVKAASPKVTIG